MTSFKHIMRLSEQIDGKKFIDDITTNTDGVLNIDFPVMTDAGGTRLRLLYNSQLQKNGILGYGWNIYVGQEYIFVDSQGSIFKDDWNYYLVMDGVSHPLKLEEDKQVGNCIYFSFFGSSNESIVYDLEKRSWYIETNDEKKIFSYQEFGFEWPDWMGVGYDTIELQKNFTKAWYISERIEKISNRTISYDYLTEIDDEKNYNRTLATLLTSISSNFGYSLNLTYSKNTNKIAPFFGENNRIDLPFLNMPSIFSDIFLLKKIVLQSNSYTQTFLLHHKIINEELYVLKSIEQMLELSSEFPFKFNYKKVNNFVVLEKLSLSSFEITYNYQLYKTPDVVLKYFCNQTSEIRFQYGSDYGVLGCLHENRKDIELHIKGKTFFDSFQTKPCLNTGSLSQTLADNFYEIADFKIKTYENVFFLLVEDKSHDVAMLFFFFRKSKECFERLMFWTHKKNRIYFSETTVILRDDKEDPIFNSPNEVELSLYLRIKNRSDWYKKSHKCRFRNLSIHRETIAVLCKAQQWPFISVTVFYTNKGLRQSSYYSSHVDAKDFENVNINDYWEDRIPEEYREFALNNSFKLYNNVVVLSHWYNDECRVLILQLTNTRVLKKMFSENIQLEGSCAVEISTDGIYIGPFYVIRKKGMNWELSKLGDSVHLGDDLYLQYKNNETKLFVDTVELMSIPLNSVIRYPQYIACPNTFGNGTIALSLVAKEKLSLLQKGDPIPEIYLQRFPYEQLSASESDWLSLVTIQNPYVIVRPSNTLMRNQLTPLLKSQSIECQVIKRVTMYEYEFSWNEKNQYLSRKMITIPGNNETLHGRFEVEKNYAIDGKNTISYRYYDSSRKEIFSESQSESEDVILENMVFKKESVNASEMFDRSNKLLICNLYPYNTTNAFYYGFEYYEKDTNLRYRGKYEIMENKFAFTGQNHLRLYEQSSLELELQLIQLSNWNKINRFTAACYVRPNNTDSLVPYFEAVLQANVNGNSITSLLGKLKFKYGLWYYLEMTIEIDKLKKIYEHYITSKGLNPVEEPGVKVVLKVMAPLACKFLDVDDIRIFPSDLNFQSTTYDALSGNPSAFLSNNALIYEMIYNKNNEKIAMVKNRKSVSFLKSSSRTGTLAGVKSLNPNQILMPSSVYLESEIGFYEDFSSVQEHWIVDKEWSLENTDDRIFSDKTRNCGIKLDIVDNEYWETAPGKLENYCGGIVFRMQEIFVKNESLAIQFFYALLNSSTLIWSTNDYDAVVLSRQRNDTVISFPMNSNSERKFFSIPTSGELTIYKEEAYLWVWLNGVLLFEEKLFYLYPITSPKLVLKNNVLIEKLFIMYAPSIKVKYFNQFHEVTQIIELENINNTLVEEILYDDLGRVAIVTKKTRMTRKENSKLLWYQPDFIINDAFFQQNSVFHNEQILGEVRTLNPQDEGRPFYQTVYKRNPLNEKEIIGRPGKDFSVTGKYATVYNDFEASKILDCMFPRGQEYSHKEICNFSKEKECIVNVIDCNKNIVARFVKSEPSTDLIATFDYDEHDRLIKVLPPIYHSKFRDFNCKTEWKKKNFTVQENQFQLEYGSFFYYDEFGRLARKSSPDEGFTNYFYNSAGHVKFLVSQNYENVTSRILFYNYDDAGHVTSTGRIKNLNLTQNLNKYLEKSHFPESEIFQRFYNLEGLLPSTPFQGSVKFAETHSNKKILFEELKYDHLNRLNSKTSTFVTINDEDEDEEEKGHDNHKRHFYSNIEVQYENENNLIRSIKLTPSLFKKSYTFRYLYDRLKRVTRISLIDDASNFDVRFTYHATGDLATEVYGNDAPFSRSYIYSSPGYLNIISDPFLSQKLTFAPVMGTSGASVSIKSVEYNATWLSDYENIFHDFKRKNFNDHCAKIRETITNEVISQCGEEAVLKILKARNFLKSYHFYGHKFIYERDGSLQRAQYFTHELPYSFPLTKIEGITDDNSRYEIILKLQNFFETLAPQNRRHRHHHLEEPINPKNILHDDLVDNLCDNEKSCVQPAIDFYLACFKEKKRINLDNFRMHMAEYTNFNLSYIQVLSTHLLEKGYLKIENMDIKHVLNESFVTQMEKYIDFLPEIVQTAVSQFWASLFDFQSFRIDKNGNYKKLYNGFHFYKFEYNKGNQLSEIKPLKDNPKSLFLKYDDLGNVVQSMHNNIKLIKYHETSNRPIQFIIEGGITVYLYYDVRGERIAKYVIDQTKKEKRETRYVRDLNGRVLLEEEITSGPQNDKKVTNTTLYFYGVRGLVGFLRNGSFYSVTTDHIGSVRLIIKNRKVVASYDYLPYGSLMRKLIIEPGAEINYLYGGQEYDKETGLYNFHARIYDPLIGRFYQVDPKHKYFNPYIYGGNSPIAMIDYDGQEAITFIIALILALIGGYLGGAAANNDWNIRNWDFSSPRTYGGIFMGSVAGALLPLGAAASISAIGPYATTIGAGVGGYLGGSAINKNWDPSKWSWEKPSTINAIFLGASTGATFFGGIKGIHSFAAQSSAIGKITSYFSISRVVGQKFFISVSYSAGASMGYVAAARANEDYRFWKWDWKDPNTYFSAIDGFDAGSGLIETGLRTISSLMKIKSGLKQTLRQVGISKPSNLLLLKAAAKTTALGSSKVLLRGFMAYLMGASANDDFDITRWNLNQFSTYEGLLNGASIDITYNNFKSASKRKNENVKFKTKNVSRSMRKFRFMVKKAIKNSRPKSSKAVVRALKKWYYDFGKGIAEKSYISLKGEDSNFLNSLCSRSKRSVTNTAYSSMLHMSMTNPGNSIFGLVDPVFNKRKKRYLLNSDVQCENNGNFPQCNTLLTSKDLSLEMNNLIPNTHSDNAKESDKTSSQDITLNRSFNFHGIMLLLDLSIRKFTGQKYSQTVFETTPTWPEASIMSGELVERFYKILNDQILVLKKGISDDLHNITLQNKVSKYLFLGEPDAINRLFKTEVLRIYNIVKASMGAEKANKLISPLNLFLRSKGIELGLFDLP